MSSIKFNTLVITAESEVIDVIVGTDIGLLSQLKETQYWDDMFEEAALENLVIRYYDVQRLSDFYKRHENNDSLVTRVSYFPDKVVFNK